jgi:hypothetical protein
VPQYRRGSELRWRTGEPDAALTRLRRHGLEEHAPDRRRPEYPGRSARGVGQRFIVPLRHSGRVGRRGGRYQRSARAGRLLCRGVGAGRGGGRARKCAASPRPAAPPRPPGDGRDHRATRRRRSGRSPPWSHPEVPHLVSPAWTSGSTRPSASVWPPGPGTHRGSGRLRKYVTVGVRNIAPWLPLAPRSVSCRA